MKRFSLTLSTALLAVSVGMHSIAEPVELDLVSLDAVTAGGVGAIDVNAVALGVHANTYSNSASMVLGGQVAGLPNGIANVAVANHGLGIAFGTGAQSSSSVSISSTNDQVGPFLTLPGASAVSYSPFGNATVAFHNHITIGGPAVSRILMIRHLNGL